ncbi:MAG: glycosyl hydrolase family 28-related protein [Candidatus Omnitrophica bacterium]|nr:glycosyl hydrolase family 28-related protein [Candidatus Omnitrophota bacterium]
MSLENRKLRSRKIILLISIITGLALGAVSAYILKPARNAMRPAAPLNLNAQSHWRNVWLYWQNNASDVDGFKIEQRIDNADFTEIAKVGSRSRGYISRPLELGRSYSYRVRAYDSNGKSDYSNVVKVTTPEPAQDIIPQERRINWDAGIPGGIPDYPVGVTVDSSYGDGIADAAPAIQEAINTCPKGRAVYLPPGVYKINSTINMKDNIALRGAGSRQTIILLGMNTEILIRGSYVYPAPEKGIPIVSGYTKGSTEITVGNASGLAENDYILISQLNDGVLVDNLGVSGVLLDELNGGKSDNRSLGQMVKVASVNGNHLTIEPALYLSFSAGLYPEFVKQFKSLKTGVGIEELCLRKTDESGKANINMDGAAYCWVKNIESEYCAREHVELKNCFRCEIRDSYFHHGPIFTKYYLPNQAYGICMEGTYACLVENNIFYHLLAPMMSGARSCGNIWGYNYSKEGCYYQPNWLSTDLAVHAPHCAMNLFEGNIGQKSKSDFIWGSSSHNTYFRNLLSGMEAATYCANYPFEFDRKNTFMNTIGNVLGVEGFRGHYELENRRHHLTDKAIYRLGYDSDGTTKNNDPNVKATLIRHGNFDYVSKSTIWDRDITSQVLPASLYLNLKPSWWRNLPWPSIGPDCNPMSGTNPAKERFEAMFPPYNDIIIDNADLAHVTIKGGWRERNSRWSGYYWNDYLDDANRGKGSKSVTFRPDLTPSGVYNVYIWYTSDTNSWKFKQAKNALVVIDHAKGRDTIRVDQSKNSRQWFLLGTYIFNSGRNGSVTIKNDNTSRFVIADAVRFEYVSGEGSS